MMRTFYKLLISTLITSTTNNFVWFALTYWVYLETKSVAATGAIAGIYLVVTALSGFWFGSIVDHNKKKTVLLGSGIATLILFTIGLLTYLSATETNFANPTNPMLWLFVIILMCGVVVGNIVNIVVPTLVATMVEEDKRDRANGLFGTVFGVGFAMTSVASGLILGFAGMYWVLLLAVISTVISLIYISFIQIPENKIIHLQSDPAIGGADPKSKKVDIKGTINVIKKIPGLFGLIFFNVFNNILGGVFMALMDAYGLTLVSVQVWGIIWGFLSFGFILGGILIAKKGLGKNPLRTLLVINLINWINCLFFTIQPSIILLVGGMALWMTLFPFIEASEQTVLQKVVPTERLGRVLGFAQSVEQAGSPLTAFFIGPLTQFIFIPFMTTGAGVDLIGGWFGVGPGRGIALVFIISGMIGLLVTIFALKSNSYRMLSAKYLEKK